MRATDWINGFIPNTRSANPTTVGLALLVFGMKPLIQSEALIFLAFNAYYLLQDIQPSRK